MAGLASVPGGLAVVCAFITSVSSFGLVMYINGFSESMPGWLISLIIIFTIPVIAYLTSLGMSAGVRHSAKCKKTDMGTVAVSNLFIALTTFITAVILALENIPWLRFIYGEYEPTNRVTGLKIPRDAVEYNEFMKTGVHYKIQTFSNLVKDACPYPTKETTKEGLVYLYFMFFMTLLPSFFIFTSQGICPK